jgi:hypothetical protein
MAARNRSGKPGTDDQRLQADDRPVLEAILAHLNFSGGKPDPRLLANINRIWSRLPAGNRWQSLHDELRRVVDELEGTTPVFTPADQARAVLDLALTGGLAAYREFHADLLFHLSDDDYDNPFFAGRMFEAVLSQQGPWDERDRILTGAVRHLSDFVGYRPVAVLENGRRMELYSRERIAPMPLFVAGAGVAATRYRALIERTLEFLREAPQDLLQEAYLDPDQVLEIVIDVRAHDHLHPVYKRTNYIFGEWDPHTIDTKGRYTRFVVRRIVLDAMLEWANGSGGSEKERLYDAAAALCGTMLMAASVSGSGPDSHNSTVSLATLLPVIAQRRDEFYSRLTEQASGPRAKRLKKIEAETRQPFGHVRQHLNMQLAGYGALQVQRRELALMFARTGMLDAARANSRAIPAASIRMECEILCELSAAMSDLRAKRLPEAAARLQAVENLLRRGIDCGAIVDPWNILGFGAQFPLFASREDAIPDNRIESLMELMAETFGVYGKVLIDAAASGDEPLRSAVSERFEKLGNWWDQFASSVIEELPVVVGQEAWESATHVATMLSEWHTAGDAAGDVSFWKQRLDRFQSAHAFGPVVDALLGKDDDVASFALMMQWLSQLDDAGTEGPQHSLLGLLIRWMKLVTRQAPPDAAGVANLLAKIRRLFAYMEANAGEAWGVPTVDAALSGGLTQTDPDWSDEQPQPPAGPSEDDEENLFGAAFEGVTFKDSADDGQWGDTLDEGPAQDDSGFELLSREIEPRLKFLNAVGQLWQLAAAAFAQHANSDTAHSDALARHADDVAQWRSQCRRWEAELLALMESVWTRDVDGPSGDHGDNIEFDLQLQVKYFLLNQIVVTLLSLKNAGRMLSGCLPATGEPASDESSNEGELERSLSLIYGSVVRRDAEGVASRLPLLLRQMQKQPLLYVPFDHGGRPATILRAQTMQSVARFLLRELPRMGLLRHTWHVLNTLFKMERRWRPEGQAITEFDRLFDIALRNSVETLIRSASGWQETSTPDDDLLNAIGELLDPYQQLWMKHSRTMRLSSVDGVRLDEDWNQLYQFVEKFGRELFHASQLTLGHVRTILHNGVRWYFEYLRREEDPLKPSGLLDAIERGEIDFDDAVWCLETLYSIVVDKFDRFLEYNTTTTQSDYGEMFYTLLDFLRLEARYDRETWNLTPLVSVHDVLARQGRREAAALWADMFEAQTAELADRHLQDLRELEQQHGMRLPAIADHLQQRFYKLLRVNEMTVLIRPAMDEVRHGAVEQPAVTELAKLTEEYLGTSWGSGVDIPNWIRALDREATEVLFADDGGRPGAEAETEFPRLTLTLREFRQQISEWRSTLAGPSPRRPNRPAGDSGKPTKPPSTGRRRGRKPDSGA